MFETKIRKVGDEAVMTLTPEMLAHLGAKVGDTICVLRSDDCGLRVMAKGSAVAAGA